jgi:hypothetical protein
MSNSTLDNLVGVNPLLTNLAVGVGADQNFIGEQALSTIVAPAETVVYRKASPKATPRRSAASARCRTKSTCRSRPAR